MSREEVALRRHGSKNRESRSFPFFFHRTLRGLLGGFYALQEGLQRESKTEAERNRQTMRESWGGGWTTEQQEPLPERHRDDVELIASGNGLPFFCFFLFCFCASLFPGGSLVGLRQSHDCEAPQDAQKYLPDNYRHSRWL